MCGGTGGQSHGVKHSWTSRVRATWHHDDMCCHAFMFDSLLHRTRCVAWTIQRIGGYVEVRHEQRTCLDAHTHVFARHLMACDARCKCWCAVMCCVVRCVDVLLLVPCLLRAASLGVVMFVMLFGYPPFYADPNKYGKEADRRIYELIRQGFDPTIKKG